MEFLPSPNFGPRRAGAEIQHLILHYTDTPTLAMAVAMLMDPAREASAHYVVDMDGRIVQLVDEKNRAWHAGKSFWAGETDINSTSIGIEIVNPGHTFGHAPFPPEQISAVIKLCQDIIARHHILPQHVLAHSDIAPARKQDPGALFPWEELAKNGVGVFPAQTDSFPLKTADDLAKYGYDIANLTAAITAFQRHFRTENINGEWDDECAARLGSLLAIAESI
jgi:N-acetylmuramoyl-L-alanine amidase